VQGAEAAQESVTDGESMQTINEDDPAFGVSGDAEQEDQPS
jgi:hypothetical protein